VLEKIWTLGYLNQNLIIIMDQIKYFYIKNILAFIFGIFAALFSPPGGEKVSPYFHENESSEASGSESGRR
jgi:hypothetical protein